MASDYGIGARLPRLEDARFLEGRGQFCADIALPGTLHAAFVRSPHAHARILAVRKPRGLEDRIYLAGDLTGVGKMRSTAKLPGFKPSDWPILAAGKVRHVGNRSPWGLERRGPRPKTLPPSSRWISRHCRRW